MEQPLGFLERPAPAATRVLWLGDPRALPVGGWSIEPGLAYALTPRGLPDAAQVFTPAGPGPASLVADAVRLALSGGTVHLGRLLASAGVHDVVVVEGLAPSTVGTQVASVNAPPPASLQSDLLQQDDLQVVPGVSGAEVFQVNENMPVTSERAAPLPSTPQWSFPAAADVVGWRPVLEDLSSGTPAPAAVGAGTLYAGYAPAGSFAVTSGGRSVAGRPAFGWAAQYGVPAGTASLRFSRFPFVPLAVLLEVVVWVALLVALMGRRRNARGQSGAEL